MARPSATVFAVLLLAALAGCRDGGEGQLYAVSGRLFVFNYRIATATYLVTLKPLAPMQAGMVAEASFENPAGGAPIVTSEKIWPDLGKVTLQSPPVRCILKDRPYAVTIRIKDSHGTVAQTLSTTLVSSLDEDVLPDRPLIVGPLYTPNPELAGRPGGKLDVTNEAGCPGRK